MTRVLAADSSVLVKWYKPDESSREEALELKTSVVSGQIILLTELLPLEVSRTITKAGATVIDAMDVRDALSALYELKMLKAIETKNLTDKANDYLQEYNLHVIDALTLPLAVNESVDLVTEDRHLLKQFLAPVLRENGLSVRRLGEL